IVAEREQEGPYTTFQQFFERTFATDLNRRALENMIRCGVFDSLGYYRSQLVDVMNVVLDAIADTRKQNLEGQFDLFGGFGGEDDPDLSQLMQPHSPEFEPMEKMRMERELTGLYLSGHPMDQYREVTRRAGAVPMGRILSDFAQEEGPTQFADEQRVCLAGIILSSRTRTTKNNTLMAYAMLEDDTGSMELILFARAMEEYGGLLAEGYGVLAEGRISVRDEKQPQLICERLFPLAEESLPLLEQRGGRYGADRNRMGQYRSQETPKDQIPGVVPGATKLYLRFDREDDPRVKKVRQMLVMFPGTGQMVLYFRDSKRRFGIPCLIHTSLVRELKRLLGEENVVVK
ncbi:MAG: DNA polymerase III subunit alpha, partial [Clostridiales bacterium]|nr:DNA polymerase III subunit alpha [Clostridiales bacterium]